MFIWKRKEDLCNFQKVFFFPSLVWYSSNNIQLYGSVCVCVCKCLFLLQMILAEFSFRFSQAKSALFCQLMCVYYEWCHLCTIINHYAGFCLELPVGKFFPHSMEKMVQMKRLLLLSEGRSKKIFGEFFVEVVQNLNNVISSPANNTFYSDSLKLYNFVLYPGWSVQGRMM